MITNFEEAPTLLAYSEKEVGVRAGGGIFGFGGIMLHEPTDRDFHSISPELNIASGEPIGIGFGYNNIATVTIAGLLKWTNYNLSRAPQGRQDLKETGLVRLEIFDTEEMREYLETESDIFEYLSIKFIG